MNIAQVK